MPWWRNWASSLVLCEPDYRSVGGLAGDVDTARKSYTRVVNELAPGLISALLQAASFERRQSNVDGAKALFDSALSTEDTEQGEELI